MPQLKPRDIRELLRGKIDPQLGTVLVKLAEDNAEIRQMIKETLTMFGQLASLMEVHTIILDQLKKDPRLNTGAAEAIRKTAAAMGSDHKSIVQSETIGGDDDA